MLKMRSGRWFYHQVSPHQVYSNCVPHFTVIALVVKVKEKFNKLLSSFLRKKKERK